jgi:predicted esterase
MAVLGAPATKPAVDTAPSDLLPGTETKFDNPKSGGKFLVYVPRDYSPAREWPVIFCYHPKGAAVMPWPFKELTNGKGFIVVGMEYVKDSPILAGPEKKFTWDQVEKTIDQEVESARQVAVFVNRRLKVARGQMFIGGFQAGGAVASAVAESSPQEMWAGVIMSNAARMREAKPGFAAPKGLRGKPIYIGTGDPAVTKLARSAELFYKNAGAIVLFEEYKDKDQLAVVKSDLLMGWLLENGPLRTARAELDQAALAEKSGRLGKAYQAYMALGGISETDPTCGKARESANGISEKAQKDLEDAEKRTANKEYVEAAKALAKAVRLYDGCEYGETAKKRLEELQASPEGQAAIAQAQSDAGADALEARGRAAETDQNVAQAIKVYEQYVAKYPQAARFAEVKKRLEELKAGKHAATSAPSDQADRDCKNWLALAENYIKVGANDKAVPYLKKIIDTYGETEWAAKARQRLAEIRK